MKSRMYAKTLVEAKKIYKAKTGVDYDINNKGYSGVRIYTLKKSNQTPTRKFFIGTYMEYINR